MSEPRSVRLNASHRADIVDAVMKEWVKQNPAPAASCQIAMLTLVANEFKKHSAYKRTVRMVEKLSTEDLKHIITEANIGVRVEDKDGNHKRDLQFAFPLSFAESLKLSHLPISRQQRTELTKDECQSIDGWYNSGSEYNYANCASFAERGNIMIVIQDDTPEMKKVEEGRRRSKTTS